MTLDTSPSPPLSSSPAGQATLIFNSQAGGTGRSSPDELLEALRGLGYRAEYRPTDSEADLGAVLAEASGTVFVAGGDGTVRAAALHLAGRAGVRLGLIPLGTANNIGRTLGIEGPPLDVIAGYAGGDVRPFDLGRVSAPWGEDLFVEACGCGAFAEVLAEYDPEEGKSPLRALSALTSALSSFEPLSLTLRLDGQPQPQETYMLLEVMNTRATGPRLRLATHADPTDGCLDVIRVAAGGRDGLLSYLAALARDSFEERPSVQAGPVCRAEIPYVGQAFHVDGQARPAQSGGSGVVRIEVWAGALQVLMPHRQEA